MKMMDLGFKDLETTVHQMPAATKLALFGSLAFLSLVYSDLLALVGVLATLLAVSRIALLWRRAMLFLRAFAIFSAIVFAINILANQNGVHVLLRTNIRFYFWTISYRLTLESISTALRMVLRLLVLVLCFVLFTMTTSPEHILRRISSFRGLHELGLLLALSYRFLPTLVSDGGRIRDSLRSRGVDFDSPKRLRRIGAYASLAVPLLMNSLERSIQLAEAMESRGYGCCARRQVQRARIVKLTPLAAWYLLFCSCLTFLFAALSWGRASLFIAPSGPILALAVPCAYLAPILRKRSR